MDTFNLEKARELLTNHWGHDDFRTQQAEIIQSVINEHDTIALLPTGGGKSICFQIPGLMLEGVALVITPLIALMKDQVDSLAKRGIKAAAIHAGMTKREVDITLDNCIYGGVKFLYISPERLSSDLFKSRAQKFNISLIAIDEAHCISQWGFDFRPSYLDIGSFIEEFGISRKIALTATATSEVLKDISTSLKFQGFQIFQKSFARSNLSYSAFKIEMKRDKMLDILKGVPGSAIVYVTTRKKAKELSAYLSENGILSSFYHAGLDGLERMKRQQAWINDKMRVMVSTNAFGMGIDKPDVRLVIHYNVPENIEAYYQEAGRAGRDNLKSYAVLLFKDEDLIELKERIASSHVSKELLKRVYTSLGNHFKLAIGSGLESTFDFNYLVFVKDFELPVLETYHALSKLENIGLIRLNEGFYSKSKLIFIVDKDDLYRFQVANANMDAIIKMLLRFYGGELYSRYMDVKEIDLARALKVSESRVVALLEQLAAYEIVEYQRASNNPRISFTSPRIDQNSLPIDEEQMSFRKNLAMDKADKMIEFASSKDRCRSRVIQSYFGEESDQNCGVCDYCLDRRKAEAVIDEKRILDRISEDGTTLIELSQVINEDTEAVTVKVRELVENGRLKIVDNFIYLVR